MRPIPYFLFFIFWFLFSWFTPTTAYWRDSGEFVLSATYLDIAHPAGFPLYSQLANIFTHIPFGAIPWRVNLFSTFLASLSLALAYVLCNKIILKSFNAPIRLANICSLIPVLTLSFSSAFLRQAYQAEVYMLNLVTLEILLIVFLHWLYTKDKRFLHITAFLAGLFLGNHISIVLAYLLILPILLIYFRSIVPFLVRAILLFTLGASVYLYIPLRAQTTPPLNTGQVINFERFYNLITNQRDWKVRSTEAQGNIPTAIESNFFIFNENILQRISKDFKTLTKEIPLQEMILAFLGMCLLLYSSSVTGYTILAVGISNWIFFAGWHPDPWLVLILSIGICLASLIVALCMKLQYFAVKSKLPIALAFASLIFIILGSYRPSFAKELLAFKTDQSVREEGKSMLKNVASNAYFLTEPSLFLLHYMTDIEGYRDDIKIIYLLDLYYPELFNRKTFTDQNGNSFSPELLPLPHTPNLQNVSGFINFALKSSSVELEPVTLLSHQLKDILQLTKDGTLLIKAGQNINVNKDFFETSLKNLENLILAFYKAPRIIALDIASRIELRAMLLADLYYQIGMPLRSVQILKLLCNQPNKELCFAPVENNLNAYGELLYYKSNEINIGN